MEEALNYLNSLMNASEASIVHQFSVWLGPHEVRVEVKDRGEKAAGPTRFSAMAYLPDMPEDERVNNARGLSHGNPAPEMVEAIDAVHWWIFSRDDS